MAGVSKAEAGYLLQGPYPAGGVFVHLQKQRLRPARALMDLSQGYLHTHGPMVEGLSLGPVHALLDQWRVRIAGLESLDFHQYPPPRLPLPEQGVDV